MRVLMILCAFATPFAVTSYVSQAVAAEAAAHARYTTEDTEIGTLLDDPAARAVLDRIIPSVSKGENIDMARSMTLKSLQQFAPDQLTDEVLGQIDAAFAKL